jgi:hypothetical protein
MNMLKLNNMIKNFQNNIRAIYTALISYVGGQFKRRRENRLRAGEQIRTNNKDMSEQTNKIRSYIDKFKDFFKRKNEEDLGNFLLNNGIDCIQLPFMFYDFRNEKIFIHFDKTFYYIIYHQNNEYILKKRAEISDFEFKIIDNFGNYYLSINGLKSMLPITRDLFGNNLEKTITDKIKYLKECAKN